MIVLIKKPTKNSSCKLSTQAILKITAAKILLPALMIVKKVNLNAFSQIKLHTVLCVHHNMIVLPLNKSVNLKEKNAQNVRINQIHLIVKLPRAIVKNVDSVKTAVDY